MYEHQDGLTDGNGLFAHQMVRGAGSGIGSGINHSFSSRLQLCSKSTQTAAGSASSGGADRAPPTLPIFMFFHTRHTFSEGTKCCDGICHRADADADEPTAVVQPSPPLRLTLITLIQLQSGTSLQHHICGNVEQQRRR